MTKGNFEKHLFDTLAGKTDTKVRVTAARQYGAGIIMTNRITDMNPEILRRDHFTVPCDECHEPCVLHPESLRAVPEGKVMCGRCANRLGVVPGEVIIHPIAILEALYDRWRGK